MHRPLAAGVLCALFLGGPASAFNAGLGEPPTDLDRSSPSATVHGFLAEARRGNFSVAAHDFWLDRVPQTEQAVVGARVARRLWWVLDRHPLDLAGLSKAMEEGPASFLAAVLDVDGKSVAVRLVRLRDGDTVAWLFSKETVHALASLDTAYDPPFVARLPHFFLDTWFGLELWQWLGLLLAMGGALLSGWLIQKLLVLALRRLARLTSVTWDDELVRALPGPVTVVLGIFAFQAFEPRLLLPSNWEHPLGLACRSLGIVAVTWWALRALDVAAGAIDQRLGARGTGAAAGTRTQMAVLWRVVASVIYVVALAALLMQFNVVRTVGVSLLASAGVVGVVLGLAAQKSIGALFAGIQLSVSQPIRIGDLVVVEGESGRVEKIGLTSVFLRLWDNRQLVVPVTYFMEKPFQNWTREGLDLVGAVLFQLDYRVDVDALRMELERILAGPAKSLWNGRLARVQVTEALEQTVTVRILASASVDAVTDLRCVVREEFLKFLRSHEDWLPTQRHERWVGPGPSEAPSPSQGPEGGLDGVAAPNGRKP